MGDPRLPAYRPLLPAAVRPLAGVLLIFCVSVTLFLGAWFWHRTRPGWLDQVIDRRMQAGLGGHPELLKILAAPGDLIPVAVLTAALILSCVATRRWRGVVLVIVAIPAADVLTELLFKPLVGRTLQGDLSLPSGHATRAFALAAVFAVLLADPPRARISRGMRLFLAITVCLVAGIAAVALVGLGVHYFTDTVAGAAVGVFAVLGTALILDWLGPNVQYLSQAH